MLSVYFVQSFHKSFSFNTNWQNRLHFCVSLVSEKLQRRCSRRVCFAAKNIYLRDLWSFKIRFECESAVLIQFNSKMMGQFENFRIGRACLLLVVKWLKPLTALSGTVYRLASSMSDHTPVLFKVFEDWNEESVVLHITFVSFVINYWLLNSIFVGTCYGRFDSRFDSNRNAQFDSYSIRTQTADSQVSNLSHSDISFCSQHDRVFLSETDEICLCVLDDSLEGAISAVLFNMHCVSEKCHLLLLQGSVVTQTMLLRLVIGHIVLLQISCSVSPTNNKGQSNLPLGSVAALDRPALLCYTSPTPKSPLPAVIRRPLLIQCYLDLTSVPAKWHLIPSNGLSGVHECDRHTCRQTTCSRGNICCSRRHCGFKRYRLKMVDSRKKYCNNKGGAILFFWDTVYILVFSRHFYPAKNNSIVVVLSRCLLCWDLQCILCCWVWKVSTVCSATNQSNSLWTRVCTSC